MFQNVDVSFNKTLIAKSREKNHSSGLFEKFTDALCFTMYFIFIASAAHKITISRNIGSKERQ